ncbi:uridylate-specific endoribonuclease B-like [Haliotis cracherodii]|uniref:uridylate-specific endoribonuclease B-like n=1 Tax=Haliotis cracherodii TaxID=6455 RepID=UPI0039E8E166
MSVMKLCAILFVVVGIVAGAQALFLLRHGTCANRCFTPNDYTFSCQCDADCETIGNCCGDFWTRCRGSEYGLVVTPKELITFAQSIWDNDVNRVDGSLYTLNYQGMTTGKETGDGAAGKLITPADNQLDVLLADHNTTYPTFIHLLDNYAANVQHAEHRPSHEIQEENKFWDAISKTKVMQLTFRFLVDNGFMKSDMKAFRTIINEMWFELYPVQNHASALSDSGFEHIMVGETLTHKTSNTTVRGFHNWVQFYQEEKAGKLDYDGFIKYAQNPDIVDVRFNWKNGIAKSSSFFVGTSPEFDMALYTVCALVHPNKNCPVTINGKHFGILTTTARHQQIQQLTSVKPNFKGTNSTAST